MSSLTVEEIKQALNRNGIPLPTAKAKKEEYVKLYEENISKIALIADTYSSDEESSQGSKKVTSTNSLSTFQNIPETVESLSDNELFEKLKDFGYNAGPVVPNTRRVYIRKLIQLLEGGGNNSRTNGATNPVEINENNISDNELEIQTEQSIKGSVRGTPSPAPFKKDRSRTPSVSKAVKTEERPVSRVSYIERIPRQRIIGHHNYEAGSIRSTSEDLNYVGRWSPRASINRIATLESSTPNRKNTVWFYIGLLLIITALFAVGYYQWSINDPYQQLQEDAENEVKKLSASKTENYP